MPRDLIYKFLVDSVKLDCGEHFSYKYLFKKNAAFLEISAKRSGFFWDGTGLNWLREI